MFFCICKSLLSQLKTINYGKLIICNCSYSDHWMADRICGLQHRRHHSYTAGNSRHCCYPAHNTRQKTLIIASNRLHQVFNGNTILVRVNLVTQSLDSGFNCRCIHSHHSGHFGMGKLQLYQCEDADITQR